MIWSLWVKSVSTAAHYSSVTYATEGRCVCHIICQTVRDEVNKGEIDPSHGSDTAPVLGVLLFVRANFHFITVRAWIISQSELSELQTDLSQFQSSKIYSDGQQEPRKFSFSSWRPGLLEERLWCCEARRYRERRTSQRINAEILSANRETFTPV